MASTISVTNGACSLEKNTYALSSKVAAQRKQPHGQHAARSHSASLKLSASHRASCLKATCSKKDIRPRKTALRAAAEDVSASAESSSGPARYGYVIANAKFMLHDEEHLAELLRERRRLFLEQEREIDFWVVPEPAWTGSLPSNVKIGKPSAAVVSTNLTWITFLKLRLDKCYKGEMEGELADVLASTPYEEDDLKFAPPKGWDAPYPRYQQDWWKLFAP